MTWLPWDRAWQEALYGTRGFYRSVAGPAGHFATAAQGLPGVGQVLAQALLALARRHRLGTVVDIGCGRGELLVELAALDAGIGLVGVDIVARPSDLPARVTWLRSPGGGGLPAALHGLHGTLVLAHEWLDVVPCPVAERDQRGVWRCVEVEVVTGRERLGAAVTGGDLDWLTTHLTEGWVRRAEVGAARQAAFAALSSRVEHGLVLAVDYGHTAASRPPSGTLTGYRCGAPCPPIPDGSCDLTAHVAADTLGAQVLWRQRAAVRDLLGVPVLPDRALSTTDPTAYLSRLGSANALATLTASGGLGDFWWASSGLGGVRLG